MVDSDLGYSYPGPELEEVYGGSHSVPHLVYFHKLLGGVWDFSQTVDRPLIIHVLVPVVRGLHDGIFPFTTGPLKLLSLPLYRPFVSLSFQTKPQTEYVFHQFSSMKKVRTKGDWYLVRIKSVRVRSMSGGGNFRSVRTPMLHPIPP